MEDDDEILHMFFEESTGLLEEVYDILKTYTNETPENRVEKINAVYRCIHSIKGGSGMLGMSILTEVAHELESHLSEIKKTPEQFDVAFITHQFDQIETLLSNEVKKQQEAHTVAADADIAQPPPLATCHDNIVQQPEEQIPQTNNQQKKETPNLIRVPLDRIQRSYDLTSEIFLLRNQITHLLEVAFESGAIQNDLFLKWEILDNSLRQRIVELESAVLSMRMTSVKSLFSRMEKTIRTYNESSEKDIQVKISGQETEIDKRILDSLGDPLIHLIRNAMDHGIERPDARGQKPRQGTISMDAKIIGNEAVFKIHDDGKGIDLENILKSAKSKGIDVSSVVTDQDILQLIFSPGFSTAQQVSEISGRGIGMDVVKTYVEKSGGSIHVDTKVGIGTTFSLYLPIGLSIIPLIVVSVGDHFYGIPTHDILQTYTLKRTDIIFNQNQYLLNIDDQFIKCIFLSNYFDNTGSEDVIMRRDIFVCLAEISGEMCAFIADKLIANTELIVKALPPGVPALHYLQGVSILTTGVSAFILSLDKLNKHILLRREGNTNATCTNNRSFSA
jgi:two-component system chemotaxis sensor kinase CheA